MFNLLNYLKEKLKPKLVIVPVVDRPKHNHLCQWCGGDWAGRQWYGMYFHKQCKKDYLKEVRKALS